MNNKMVVYVVKDKYGIDVLGQKQLIKFAKEQLQYLIDYVDRSLEQFEEIKDVDVAMQVISMRGFSVTGIIVE